MRNNQGCKTRKQMAEEYKVTRKTFYRMRQKAGIVLSNGLITPKEQEIIYEVFGKTKNVP